jgi:Complex I intermediate-associated protein 30 (CIA30)
MDQNDMSHLTHLLLTILAGLSMSRSPTPSCRAVIPTKTGEWTNVRIPIKDCYATSFGQKVPNARPVDSPMVNSSGFMLSDKKAGPFKLEIAWIKAIGGKPKN